MLRHIETIHTRQLNKTIYLFNEILMENRKKDYSKDIRIHTTTTRKKTKSY